MDNLSNLKLFVRVALLESFAAAARIEGMTSSALSKAVQRLEAEVGAKLFTRTTRSVGLTVEGERFLEGARKLIDDAEALKAECADSLLEPRGKLVVSASAAFGRAWLTDRILAFMCRYKNVEVELRFEDRIVDLASERIDVAIRVGELGDNANLVARKLFDDPVYTVAAPSYIARNGHPKRFADLEGHRGIHYRAQNSGRLFPFVLECKGNTVRRTLDPVLIGNDVDAIHQAAEAGLEIAQVPSYLVQEVLAQ